jgi:hypothetical protein
MGSFTIRDRMIQQQLVARGIRDARVLRAMREVDCERFVPPIWSNSPTRTPRCRSTQTRPSRNPTSWRDEWIWRDETHAEDPLDVAAIEGMPQTYPFGR